MKLNSFRFKIGLLNLLLSGGVLLIFGLFFMSVISRIGYERIDRELRVLADLQARRPFPQGRLDYFEESLRNLHGKDAKKQFVIKATSRHGETMYISSYWPSVLADRKLPVLDPAGNTDSPYEEYLRPLRSPLPLDGAAFFEQ